MTLFQVGAEPQSILNAAFYRFIDLSGVDLISVKYSLREQGRALGIKGTILLAKEGVNGFLAGQEEVLRKYLETVASSLKTPALEVKYSWSSHVPFTRMLVKVKEEIIAMGEPDLNPAKNTGPRMSPAELREILDDPEKKKDVLLLDTRNRYEISEGTFKGAVHFPIDTFKQFPEKLKERAEEFKDKKVVMFCTGGIRCEKATALAQKMGIENAYQLEGGILKYFEDVGGAHYRGDCFVFDGRETVDHKLRGELDRRIEGRKKDLHFYVEKGSFFHDLFQRYILKKKIPAEIGFELPEGSAQKWYFTHSGLKFSHASLNTVFSYLEEIFPFESLLPIPADAKAQARGWIDSFDRWLAAEATEENTRKLTYRIKNVLRRRETLTEGGYGLPDLLLEVFLERDPSSRTFLSQSVGSGLLTQTLRETSDGSIQVDTPALSMQSKV